ncbi:MAG: VOC family protein [Cyanobacteria bacterium J06628_3]
MKPRFAYNSLNIDDYQVSKRFYCDILNFEVIFADDNNEYAELSKGHTKVTIFNYQRWGNLFGENEFLNYDSDCSGIIFSVISD